MTVTTGPQHRLSHLDDRGAARMVDVSEKVPTARSAVAVGVVHTSVEVISLLTSGGLPKGDALATARVAGILAAKRTSDLIPLCHQLALSNVDVSYEITDSAIELTATVSTTDRTGVEMEALTAASVGLLTIYDMCKAVDRGMVIEDIRLLEKLGGKSGHWQADRMTDAP